MNRLKVWVYALLVVAAGAVTLRAHAARLRARELGELDARLAAAATQVGAATRALAREASAAAAFAGRDAQLVQALHAKEAPSAPLPSRGKRAKAPPPLPPADEEAQETALREAARAALASAERTFGFDLPGSTVVTAGNREWLARKGEAGAAEGEAMALLRGAIAGDVQRGWVRLNGAFFYAAASPAGEGAGLVVLVPVDEAWLRALGAGGTDVTLSVPEVKALSTARAADAQALSPWTMGAGAAVGIGTLAKVNVPVGPVKLPALPPLLGPAPAQRARAVPFEGVEKGFLVVSLATAPVLAPVLALEWQVAAGLALVLLAGLVLGLFVRSAEAPAAIPEDLLAAAVRIERGDFSARAPALAGKLGTLATALNRAAELAGPVAAAHTARASVTDEFFARGPKPEAPAAAPPAAAPAQVAPPAPSPFDAVPAAPAVAASDLLQAAARTAAPATVEVDEEAHWQQVFQDFLRTRASCGEPSEGLTYEKFRVKLEGNKAALTAKYACKTVRFQVYVKEGKAALKATPVR